MRDRIVETKEGMEKKRALSEEHKREISETLKGTIPWNKGLTKETDERVAKYAKSVGKTVRKYYMTHDSPFKGKHHTEETKSQMRKNRMDVSGDNNPMWGKRGKNSPHFGERRSKKTRRQMSKSRKKYLNENPEELKKLIERFISIGCPSVNTSIERKVKEQLSKMNIRFIQQWVLGNKFICDFFIPDLKLIIECDGDYFHNLPQVKIRDKLRDSCAKEKGYSMLRLPENEIKNDNFRVSDYLW